MYRAGFGFLAGVDIEEVETRVVANGADEGGVVGKLGRAGDVTYGRALKTDETLVRRRWLAEDFETDGTEQTQMALEHAVSAEASKDAPLTDVVEEDDVPGVTAPALRDLVSLHRVCIGILNDFRVTLELSPCNGNPRFQFWVLGLDDFLEL
ncbi:hypothetical protein SLE2022_093000 [Rubroshorea leprosula]